MDWIQYEPPTRLHNIPSDSDGKNISCENITSQILVAPTDLCDQSGVVLDPSDRIPNQWIVKGKEDCC